MYIAVAFCIFLSIAGDFAAPNFDYLGCWKGRTSRSNLRNGNGAVFGQLFHGLANSVNLTNECFEKAKQNELDYFVISRDGCRGDVHTGLTFRKFGESNECGRNDGMVYGRRGVYNQESSFEDAFVQSKQTHHPIEGSTIDTRTKLIFKHGKPIDTEVVRKDVILMNKIFRKLYGDAALRSRVPDFMEPYPDNDHFSSYYKNEADIYTGEKRTGSQLAAASKQNLFWNPSFEFHADNVTGLSHWNCLGEINHGHAGIMTRTTSHKRDGDYAGICTHRVGLWAGPGQFVGNAVKGGRAYKIHGWTKLLNASKADLHHIELWLRFQGNEVKNNSETRILLARRDKYNKNDGWQEWNGQFFLPSHKPGFRYIYIYFKGPKRHVDIVLDDMKLLELPLEEDWLRKTKEATDKLRKRDVTIRVKFQANAITAEQLNNIRVKVTQKRNHFGFGSAVNHKALSAKPAYRNFFLSNFEWGVPENALKWTMMEEKKGDEKHCEMDVFVSTLQKYNITMRGHCIFWEVDTESPKWLDKLDRKKLFSALKERLENTVRKYREKIAHWDVNNEMLHGSYFADELGPKIRDWMYKSVHKEDPVSRLFVNDFDVLANGIYTQSYIEQIMGFKRRKVPVHGIGVQGHFMGWTHPSIIKERLDILAQAKIPIWITELDVLEHNETRRAKALEHIMRVAYAHPGVSGIILWAFWSKAAWRGADTALMDDNFNLNKAGKRYLDLRDEWTTKLTLSPSSILKNSCEFKFRGFHGIYDISVLFPDGQKITNEVNVFPSYQPLVVEIKTQITD